MVLLKVELGLI